MIKDVKIKKLKLIPDYRGRLMEILRNDDPLFKKFGQAYMTSIKPNIVKAWHYHKKQTDNLTCVNGKLRVGLYDARKNSPTKGKTQEIILDSNNPLLVQIPPGIYHGWENMEDEEAIVISLPDLPYNYENPDEFRVDPFNNDIPLKWKAEKGG